MITAALQSLKHTQRPLQIIKHYNHHNIKVLLRIEYFNALIHAPYRPHSSHSNLISNKVECHSPHLKYQPVHFKM